MFKGSASAWQHIAIRLFLDSLSAADETPLSLEADPNHIHRNEYRGDVTVAPKLHGFGLVLGLVYHTCAVRFIDASSMTSDDLFFRHDK